MRFIIVLPFLLISSECYNQTYELPNVVKPSPESRQLEKYIDFPVGTSSGVPEINIPIYNIEIEGVSIPISISYHASGLKVDDKSGIVGLGWSLNAGGRVSRSIARFPDEQQKIKTAKYDYEIDPDRLDDFELLRNYAKSSPNSQGSMDGEYDVFSYFFGHRQGRFFMTFDSNDNIKFKTFPFEPLKIASELSNTNEPAYILSFQILDEQGNIYIYGNNPTTGRAETEFCKSSVGPNRNYATGWFLNKIVTHNNKDTINFFYQDSYQYESSKSYMLYMMDDYKWEGGAVMGNNCSTVMPEATEASIIENYERVKEGSSMQYFSKRLTQIDFPNGSAYFKYDSAGGEIIKLKSIEIYALNKLNRKFELQQSKFSNCYLEKIYKLDSLTIRDSALNIVNKYKFQYDQSKDMTRFADESDGASSKTNGMDLWGFYNGKDNNPSNLPSVVGQTVMYCYYIQSACNQNKIEKYNQVIHVTDRATDETSMKAFILTKIEYPTGGRAEYEFEANKANNISVGGLRIKNIKVVSRSGPDMVKEYRYGLSEDGNGKLFQPMTLQEFTTTKRGYKMPDMSGIYYDCSSCQVSRIETIPSSPIYSYRYRSVSTNPVNEAGKFGGNPVNYEYVSEYMVDTYGLNSKTVSVFSLPNYNHSQNDYQFYIRNYDPWWGGQLLRRTSYIKDESNYKMVKDEQFEYSRSGNEDTVRNLKVTQLLSDDEIYHVRSSFGGYMSIPPSDAFSFHSYYFILGRALLVRKTILEYSGDSQLKNEEYYYYSSKHNNPVKITGLNSKGDSIVTILKYPYDYVNVQPYNDMINLRNMNSAIITRARYRINGASSIFLDSTRNEFGFWSGVNWAISSGKHILPKFIVGRIGSFNLDTIAKFNLYDEYGNILEQQKKNNVKEAYLWGYKRQYPVARIIGSSYNDVKGLVNQQLLDSAHKQTDAQVRTELNKLRTGLGGTSAQVFTYTLSPLFGITSNTDPSGRVISYEYDAFNRLGLIRDEIGKVIKKNRYSYLSYPSGTVDTSSQWEPTGLTRCVKNGANQNTGSQEIEERDINMSSPSYNHTRWVSAGQNLSACPLPSVFYNVERTQYVTRNNCSTGYTGSSVAYTVPAGKYSSAISQADADLKAQNEITVNGQNYANTNAVCSAVCSFVAANSKYTIVSNDVFDMGNYILFNISFYATSGTVYWDESNNIANLNGFCKPSTSRTINVTENGTDWKLTMSSSGVLNVRVIGGTAPAGMTVINLYNVSYQK